MSEFLFVWILLVQVIAHIRSEKKHVKELKFLKKKKDQIEFLRKYVKEYKRISWSWVKNWESIQGLKLICALIKWKKPME